MSDDFEGIYLGLKLMQLSAQRELILLILPYSLPTLGSFLPFQYTLLPPPFFFISGYKFGDACVSDVLEKIL
jgi:hypothetical protein